MATRAQEHRQHHRAGFVAQFHHGRLHRPVFQTSALLPVPRRSSNSPSNGSGPGVITAIGPPRRGGIARGEMIGADKAIAVLIDQYLQHAALANQPHRLDRAERRKLTQGNEGVASQCPAATAGRACRRVRRRNWVFPASRTGAGPYSTACWALGDNGATVGGVRPDICSNRCRGGASRWPPPDTRRSTGMRPVPPRPRAAGRENSGQPDRQGGRSRSSLARRVRSAVYELTACGFGSRPIAASRAARS